jgi:hypothetical protein
MHLLVKPIRKLDEVKQAFVEDGWRVKQAQRDVLHVEHPHVTDGRTARARLHALGLLTSSCCQIDFAASR